MVRQGTHPAQLATALLKSSGRPSAPPGVVLIVRGHIILSVGNLSAMPKEADILVRFGERVRDLRKKAALSQEHFAERCQLDRTYVGGIERGERNVSLRNIAIIARALGVTIAELTKGL